MRLFFERLVAFLGLLAASPFLAVSVILIRLDSPGAALFRQERVGIGKTPFTCLKLRTMASGTKQAGTHEISAASVTRIGRLLRATKLDEIPQLWNVVRGEMAFVGPRPCLPSQTELVREREIRGVYEVLPGITGLGQVRGIDMSDPVRLAEVDGEYVRNRSLPLDLRLALQTVCGGGSGDRVKSR
ncbi:MAG: sugar transferase [Verrucomicrobiae bacterium]|nr:sugar transferase [Verrucomicrobiae bacterium]